MYDYLDSVINLSWMYMHDKKSDLLWQTRIITAVYFFVVSPLLNPRRNVFGLKTNIVLRCFLGFMKNRVLVSVGWPAQQMGCWSTTYWEAKNTSCMVQRQVKKRYQEPSTKEKNNAPDVLLQSCRQPPLLSSSLGDPVSFFSRGRTSIS